MQTYGSILNGSHVNIYSSVKGAPGQPDVWYSMIDDGVDFVMKATSPGSTFILTYLPIQGDSPFISIQSSGKYLDVDGSRSDVPVYLNCSRSEGDSANGVPTSISYSLRGFVYSGLTYQLKVVGEDTVSDRFPLQSLNVYIIPITVYDSKCNVLLREVGQIPTSISTCTSSDGCLFTSPFQCSGSTPVYCQKSSTSVNCASSCPGTGYDNFYIPSLGSCKSISPPKPSPPPPAVAPKGESKYTLLIILSSVALFLVILSIILYALIGGLSSNIYPRDLSTDLGPFQTV
jgi:hypothetical protein